MIRADNMRRNYLTELTNGEHVAQSDTTLDKGGSNLGFRPHELLEAALASCMNMTLRMAAAEQGISLSTLSVTVSLNRTNPEKPTFEYQVQFRDALSNVQRERLLASVANSPVRNTLSKALHFKHIGQQDGT